MALDHKIPDEHTRLLEPVLQDRRLSQIQARSDRASSIVDSHITKEEQNLSGSTIGERLNYNEYTTIDWMHDLVCIKRT